MSTITTTRGPMDEASLAKIVGVEDRPTAIVLWIEWRLPEIKDDRCVGELVRRDAFKLPRESGAIVETASGMLPRAALERQIGLVESDGEYVVSVEWRRGRGGDIVRRDCHVVLKQSGVEAAAIAAALA